MKKLIHNNNNISRDVIGFYKTKVENDTVEAKFADIFLMKENQSNENDRLFKFRENLSKNLEFIYKDINNFLSDKEKREFESQENTKSLIRTDQSRFISVEKSPDKFNLTVPKSKS